MQTVKFSGVLKDSAVRKKVISSMVKGDIFIYPTDTVYGIGCNADVRGSVKMIAELKGRKNGKSFSVIAPGKEWIEKNARIDKSNRKLVDSLLPGPYTVILDARSAAPSAVVSGEKSIGVRIPRHRFSELVGEAGVPFVTTSVNISGEEPACSISEVPRKIMEGADWAIDGGKLEGSSSRVFDLRNGKVEIVRH